VAEGSAATWRAAGCAVEVRLAEHRR